jgi:endonuclease YncB( thermonuclease family)
VDEVLGVTRPARRIVAIAIVAVSFVAARPSIARAAWTGGTNGNGYSKAVSVPQASAPSGVVNGRDVAVSWPVTRLPDNTPVSSYTVRRFDAGSGTSQTVAASCAGTIAALTCTEFGVAPGSWKYAVVPVQGQWLGPQSPNGATVTVASPSLSLSTTTISALPSTSGGSVASFLDGESVTFRLDNATSGTVLTGSTTPSPVPTGGSATVSVTIPLGTVLGSHTVYAVGSGGSTASAAINVVDTTSPTVSAAVIGKIQGGTPGFVKQGGTFYVYANATDTGSTASGVAAVVANVGNLATGQTAVALAPGSFSVGGVSYGYRSVSITANNPLAAGAKTFTVTATDVSANTSAAFSGSVTVDNTVPTATSIQTANKTGGTARRAEAGDTITYTFSEAIDPNSILLGWTGTSQAVTLRLNQVGAADTVTIFDSANTTQLPFGTVALGRTDYVTANASFTGSTMVMTGSTITITLGTLVGATTTAAGNGTMAWTPSTIPTDPAANACAATVGNESGAADGEF